MSDDSFFREVNEELRSDRAQAFWSAYGKYIITVAVVIVLAIAGWRGWEYYQTTETQRQGDAYLAAIDLAQDGSREEALVALGELEADANPTYRALARMRHAAVLLEGDDKEAAAALYDEVAADNGVPSDLRDMATIRAAMVFVDIGTVDDVSSRVQRLTAPSAPYRGSAREALGLAHYKAGDLEAAFTEFKTIADDVNLPTGLRQRSGILLDVIASKGGPVYEQGEQG
jgi:hypothetical protein